MGVPLLPIDCFNIFIGPSAVEVFLFFVFFEIFKTWCFSFSVGREKSQSPGETHLQALKRVFFSRIFLCHNYGENERK